MPQKPNYRFERFERERKKAAKKEAREKAKQEKAALRQTEDTEQAPPVEESSE